LVVLEFSTPRRQPLRGAYLLYFRRVLPWIGRVVSKHRSAYSYLPESVLAFPEPEALRSVLAEVGFDEVWFKRLFGGIVAIHVGRAGGRADNGNR